MSDETTRTGQSTVLPDQNLEDGTAMRTRRSRLIRAAAIQREDFLSGAGPHRMSFLVSNSLVEPLIGLDLVLIDLED